MNLPLNLAGLLVGFLVGLTGVGGGSLMAPLLILIFGFNPSVAVGTDLWFAALTKTVGGVIHRKVGSPDWQVIRRLATGSIPAAVLTVIWLKFVQGGRLKSELLNDILGAALIATAGLMLARKHIRDPLRRLKRIMGPGMRHQQMLLTVAAGAFVGVLVTLTSIGAGAVVAVILIVLYPVRLSTKSVVGTDIIHAIPLAAVAALGQSWLGNVDWGLLTSLLVGSIPGIIAGSFLAGRVNETVVRVALALMLVISGFKLIVS